MERITLIYKYSNKQVNEQGGNVRTDTLLLWTRAILPGEAIT